MGRYNIGGIVAAILIAVFCALTGPDGAPVYIAPGNVDAVIAEPGVGRAPTAVIMGNGTVYVQEDVATVIARLRGAREAEKTIGDDK